MLQAATEAARAATAAAQTGPNNLGKLVKQPQVFGATSLETEHKEWRAWKARFLSWLSLQNKRMHEMLEYVDAHPSEEKSLVDYDPEDANLAVQLHSLLLSFT